MVVARATGVAAAMLCAASAASPQRAPSTASAPSAAPVPSPAASAPRVAEAPLPSASAARAPLTPSYVFALSVAVALRDGAPVRDDAWIDEQIADANRLYAPMGVAFRRQSAPALPERHAEVHTQGDRDGFASLAGERRIDVFLVAALEDVDEPGRMRKGVCWTSRPDKKRYIVLSAIAPRTVLAHELGHFFGNPHVTTEDNVMSYRRTGAFPFFDGEQSARIRAAAVGFVRRGRLLDVRAQDAGARVD